MDLSKYPVEKLLYFVAGVVPGFVALLVYQVAVPNSFAWFFSLGFVGYRTKLAIVLLTAFLIGNSVTRFLSGILGAIGGVIGSLGYRPPDTLEVAPWRDPTWRVALTKVLREPPNDTRPLTQPFYDLRLKEIEFLPEAQRGLAVAELNLARLKNAREDGEWARWYDYYHQQILQPSDRDFFFHVQRGLHFNLQAAALYLLIAAAFVRGVRHWWCIFPACFWVLLLLAEEFSGLQQVRNKWSTLDKQITHLTELGRGQPSPRANPVT